MPKDQSDYPMVERYLTMMPGFEKEHNEFRCQLQAILNYLEQCNKAFEELRSAIVNCRNSSQQSK